MAQQMEERFIIGLWKFDERVTKSDLREIAQGWTKDDSYKEVYIRLGGKNQWALGFIKTTSGTKKDQDDYFDKTSDFFKRKFGNGLVGWDISGGSENEIIKHDL